MDDLTLATAAIAWGLVAASTLAHLANYELLRSHLALHLDQDRAAAGSLVAWEGLLAVAFPIAVSVGNPLLLRLAGVAFALTGVCFVLWVGRLVATDSDKPCACSSSDAPPNHWSVLRAALVATGGLLLGVSLAGVTGVDRWIAITAGAALGTTLYVLPDAMSWPPASSAQLARLDAHAPQP